MTGGGAGRRWVAQGKGVGACRARGWVGKRAVRGGPRAPRVGDTPTRSRLSVAGGAGPSRARHTRGETKKKNHQLTRQRHVRSNLPSRGVRGRGNAETISTTHAQVKPAHWEGKAPLLLLRPGRPCRWSVGRGTPPTARPVAAVMAPPRRSGPRTSRPRTHSPAHPPARPPARRTLTTCPRAMPGPAQSGGDEGPPPSCCRCPSPQPPHTAHAHDRWPPIDSHDGGRRWPTKNRGMRRHRREAQA